jgi:hypothetical protein
MNTKKTPATLTSIDDKRRVEVLITDKPQQTFDISALLDYAPMAEKLLGQPYRIYSPDNTIIQTGVMGESTSIIKTATAMKIRCEIGAGKWKIQEDGYNETDVDRQVNEGEVTI